MISFDSVILRVLQDGLLAFFVGVGFALLFNAPKKAVIMAGLLGAGGHMLRFVLREEFEIGIIAATLAGSLFIGFCSIGAAHVVHTPPVVFSMPACITMIPGLYAYRTMIGVVKIADTDTSVRTPGLLTETFHNFVLTGSLLFALAIGISVGSLLFRKKSVKHLRLRGQRKT
ncbi:threonine/serine exporter family protein [Danxiaibacter flavus]|uniref:Threonine/serine exporter family protein n=1 Tax=Danxiaibacter flavus TaxID=3049108 RepID=A0ABV3ZGS1_9BACT|nr:threonine/serine exporter family protein [Chitinophagaceae bacterium DXS]